ncbi:MAG: ABC transporter ATP-binding protein [Candidatus Riflebacteria bacterium]|nr:ABC transporter ATP-binding protein [Candidatus Riflebacteria bacterium]
MNEIAIRVEGIGKKFKIFHEVETKRSLLKNFFHKIKRKIFATHYEDFWALRNISFEIKKGDRIGLIGPNGSGKSTLLKILSRIYCPTEGRVTIFGNMCSFLELEAGFHPDLTGRENIFLNGVIFGQSMKKIHERFDEIVNFAGVKKFIDIPIKHFSSGMFLRLGFSVAINLVEPDIIIMDETFAVGDLDFKKKVSEKIDHFVQSGKTFLVVSHDFEQIRKTCSKIIHLEKGKIIFEGGLEGLEG